MMSLCNNVANDVFPKSMLHVAIISMYGFNAVKTLIFIANLKNIF